MSKEMIISVNGREKKIAIIENDQVTEFYIERGEGEQGIVGNIYKGRVMRVLPGMQSAFVDIGLERDAFLYVSDFFDEEEEFERIVIDQPKTAAAIDTLATPTATTAVAPPRRGGRRDEATEPAQIAAVSPLDEATKRQTRGQAAPRSTAADARGQREEGQRDKRRGGERNERGDRNNRNDRNERSGGTGRDRQRQPQFVEPTEDANVVTPPNESSERGISHATNDFSSKRAAASSSPSILPTDDFGADDSPLTSFIAADPDFERVVDEEARAHEGEMFKDARLQERLSDQARAIEFDLDTETETPFASSLGAKTSAQSSFERVGDDDDLEDTNGGINPSPTANVQTLVAASIRQFGGEIAEEDAAATFTAQTANFERVSDDEDTRFSFAAAPQNAGRDRAQNDQAEVGAQSLAETESESSTQARQKRGSKERVKKQRGGKQSATVNLTDASDNAASASDQAKPKAKRGAAASTAATETEATPATGNSGSATRSRRSPASAKQASKSRKSANDNAEDGTAASATDASTSTDASPRRSRSRKGKSGDTAANTDSDSDSFVAEDLFAEDVLIDAEASINQNLTRAEFARRRRRRGGAGRTDQDGKTDQETNDAADGEPTMEESSDEFFVADTDPDFGDLREAFADPLDSDDELLATLEADDTDAPALPFPTSSIASSMPNVNNIAVAPLAAANQIGDGNNDNSISSSSSNQRESSPRESKPRERASSRRGASGNGGGGRNDRRGERGHSPAPVITDLLREGQEILVQIAKEPISAKGARITSHIALPGRFLVYMPTIEHVGVSRKIESDSERIRLRRLIKAIREEEDVPSGGFIVRTAGIGIIEEELREDARYLVRLWRDMRRAAEKPKAPMVVHRDLDLIQRLLRDQLSDDFTAIRVDTEDEYQRIVEFINLIQPRMVNRVKLHTREESILVYHGVQAEIEKAIKPRVWLRSGGYLVINQTEALVAIDVNTGKFVGRGGNRLEDTITKTNLEAVDEIARQIRLRDLGGIIVLDLIDMEDRRNRNRVLQALHEALEQDKSPNKVLSFNDFGLVIMTRKRVKQSLERTLCVPCQQCQGSGMVKSPQTISYEVLEQARTLAREMNGDSFKQATLRVHTEVARALRSTERDVLSEIEDYLGAIDVTSDEHLHPEQFDFAFI